MKIVRARGYPKFHALPKFTKWGKNISLFWLRHEWVLMYGSKK